MGSVHETVKTVNSSARTLMAAILMGVAGFAGYQGYEIYHEPQLELKQQQVKIETLTAGFHKSQTALKESQAAVGTLQADLSEKVVQIDKLDTSLRLMKTRRRLARLDVLNQSGEESDNSLLSKVAFVETNEEGSPIGEPQEFEIAGDMVYIEYLVAKFDDAYIEQADLQRGVAICLFQRIFGENQEPSDGFQLDQVGTRPTAYARGTAMSEFEEQIWKDFWTLANDPEAAKSLGIRAAHGNAASIRVRPGQSYQLDLRASGEFTLRPLESTAQ